MSRRWRCLTYEESGLDLDKIDGILALLPEEVVLQAAAKCGNGSPVRSRCCPLARRVLVWVVLAMALFTDRSIRQVFRLCRRFHRGDVTPSRSALCRGRQRLGAAPIRAVHDSLVQCLGTRDRPGCFYKGHRCMGIDGVTFTVPDTPANERAFGRPKGGSTSQSVGAFPIVGKVNLVELGTHVDLASAFRAHHQGEPTIARRLIKHLTPEMLVFLDAGFFGYCLLRMIMATGAKFIVRVQSGPILKPIRVLSDGSYLSKIYPCVRDRERDRNGQLVRVIEYTLDDPQRTGHNERHRLVTNLLDEIAYPATELIVLYHERWEHELVNDEQKTHQDPKRPTKPTHLRSETPAGVIQELAAISVVHYLVRKIMWEAAGTVEPPLDVDRLSFTGTFHILQARIPECPSDPHEARHVWFRNLLYETLEEKVPPRRNRINPRVLKQPRAKWPSKKPEHRSLPPLRKSFRDCVVIQL